MTKKVFLLLVPLLALILSINGKCVAPAFVNNNLKVVSSLASWQRSFPFQVNLEKDNKNLIKKPIRIKACDDAITPSLGLAWSPCFPCLYFARRKYAIYSIHRISSYLYTRSLRGPPSGVDNYPMSQA